VTTYPPWRLNILRSLPHGRGGFLFDYPKQGHPTRNAHPGPAAKEAEATVPSATAAVTATNKDQAKPRSSSPSETSIPDKPPANVLVVQSA